MTLAELIALIHAELPDNHAGEITAARLRGALVKITMPLAMGLRLDDPA